MKNAGFEVDANPFPGKPPGGDENSNGSDKDNNDDNDGDDDDAAEAAMRENPFKKLRPRRFSRLKEQNSAKDQLSTEQIEADLKAVANKELPKNISEVLNQLGEEFADVDIAEQRAMMERIAQANHGFKVIISRPLSLLHTQTNAPSNQSKHQGLDSVMHSSTFDSPKVNEPAEAVALRWQKPSTINTYLTRHLPSNSTLQAEELDEVKWCDHCRFRDGHSSKECPTWQPGIGKCLNCGKIGSHYTTKCPQKCRNCAESHHVGICPLPLKRPLHDV